MMACVLLCATLTTKAFKPVYEYREKLKHAEEGACLVQVSSKCTRSRAIHREQVPGEEQRVQQQFRPIQSVNPERSRNAGFTLAPSAPDLIRSTTGPGNDGAISTHVAEFSNSWSALNCRARAVQRPVRRASTRRFRAKRLPESARSIAGDPCAQTRPASRHTT